MISKECQRKLWMDCVEEDPHITGITKYDITAEISLREVARDRSCCGLN